MYGDGLLIIRALIGWAWRFFVSFELPGTHITPALAMIGLSVITMAVKFIRGMVGLGNGSAISGNIGYLQSINNKANKSGE